MLICFSATSGACLEAERQFKNYQDGFLFLLIQALLSGGKSVAVGAGGLGYISNDGQTWEPVTITSDSTININGITWTGSRFVAVGGNATSCAIFTSTDGQNWQPAIKPVCSVSLFAVTADPTGQKLMAVGDMSGAVPIAFSSNDGGSSWFTVTGAGSYRYTRVVFANNQFMAVNDPQNSFDISSFVSDGISIFTITANAPQPSAGKGSTLADIITVGNSVYQSGNDATTLAPSPMRSGYTTDNGTTTWINNSINIFAGNTTNFPRALSVNNNNRMVALGDNCMTDFTDDIINLTWTGVANTVAGCSGIGWTDMIHDGSKFIAVGANGSSEGQSAVSATGDPASWTINPIGTTQIYAIARQQ